MISFVPITQYPTPMNVFIDVQLLIDMVYSFRLNSFKLPSAESHYLFAKKWRRLCTWWFNLSNLNLSLKSVAVLI